MKMGIPEKLRIICRGFATERVNTAQARSAVGTLNDAADDIERLEALIADIRNFAHERSAGPAVEDDLWEVRRMAYGE
jgi:hypothetical protein